MGTVSLIRPEHERPNSWTRFKENISHIISEALLILRQRTDLVKDEKELNRLLFFCICEVYAKLEIDYPLPAPEAKNPPHPEDKQKAKRENNIPDFSWNLMDYQANYGDWHRNFALECKRLGQKTSNNWILNEQYAIEGILRFFQEEKGYGKGCETGAMAGYVQDMEFDTVLNEVNSYIAENELTIVLLAMPTNGWQTQGVSYLAHTFQRSFIPLSFSLQHYWVDMRDCPFLAASTNTVDSSAKQQHQSSHEKNNKKTAYKKKRSPKASTQNSYQLALPTDQGQEAF